MNIFQDFDQMAEEKIPRWVDYEQPRKGRVLGRSDVRMIMDGADDQKQKSHEAGFEVGASYAVSDWVRSNAKAWVKEQSGYPLIRIDLIKV
ncbi:MAG: hypothetical protein HQL19_05085 [Candidatus Omnitrophica bacterium]|nr:hypothetical protein [Candidatus Omnitrophota bacterium]